MAQLRKRWRKEADSSLLLQEVPRFLQDGSVGGILDLRGAEIGMDYPLADFQLIEKSFSGLDLSFGKGCLKISHATVTGLEALRFQFDRASYFMKSSIVDSSFSESRGRYDAVATEFRGCRFDRSVFKGGFNEYGFRRCKFLECSFVGIDWRNTYVRASEFHNCDFTDSRLTSSVIVGMKFFGFSEWQAILDDCSVSSIYVNGEQVHP